METRPLSNKDAKKLLSVKDKRDRLYFGLSLYAGKRVGENLSLKWYMLLDPKGPKLKSPKQKKYLYFPKSDALIELIKECYEDQDKDEYVFIGRRGTLGGSPMTSKGINKMIKRYFCALGIVTRGESSHCLRKTFGRNYYDRSGGDFNALMWLQKYFGHSDPGITIRYIGLEEEELAAKVNKVSY